MQTVSPKNYFNQKLTNFESDLVIADNDQVSNILDCFGATIIALKTGNSFVTSDVTFQADGKNVRDPANTVNSFTITGMAANSYYYLGGLLAGARNVRLFTDQPQAGSTIVQAVMAPLWGG